MIRNFTHVDDKKDSFVYIPDSKVVHETQDFVLDTKELRRK
jgi:hypothetical protein